MKTMLTLILSMLLGTPFHFDRTVYDFGEISEKDGPQSCTFTITNDSDEPLTILAVVSSCGCTNVEWTRESIAPGAKGTVKATYSNNEGPFSFDKRLSVYLSAQNKAEVLHIKGTTVKQKKQ